MTQQEFINKVGLKATADMLKTGVLASVTVAQAILESGYGTTILATKAHNLFGMKCSLSGNTWSGSTWDGKRRCMKETGEEYNGQNVTITADFRVYDSWDESIADHSAYLLGAKNGNELRYAGIQGERDYRRAIAIIKDGGFATDSLYVSKVCSIIETWGLARFDGEETIMGITIDKTYISTRNTKSGTMKPKYIVIHNTDNYNAGANALAHAKSQYNGNFVDMSCHFYTDDKNKAYQATPTNKGAWHVGINYGGRLFGAANNNNTVGIEMCVQSGYNYEKAFQNTVELCKHLMKELGIDADHVVQHYDVCAKNCPSAIRAKGDWGRFKSLIAGASVAEKEWLELGDSGNAVKELQGNLIKLGYSCGDAGADGVFGEDTDAAVRKFQAANGLSVDGQAGKATRAKIKELLTPKVESDAIKYYVQAGAFKSKGKAQELVDKLKAAGFDAIIKDA